MQDRLKRFKKAKPAHPVLHKTVRPFREFMRIEASGGILVILTLMVAVLWVNLPFGSTYDMIWSTRLSIGFAGIVIDEPLGFWINDFLMAIFFFLIGLEIKRELLIGWLCSYEQAILPVIAALGAMLVPALIYSGFNPPGSPGAVGWAIPMATDIAICLGILNLFGNRIPTPVKVFLTTMAIVDDLAGIGIIAVFYSHGLQLVHLILSVVLVGLLFAFNRLGVRRYLPYVVVGIALWTSMLFSGIHPTLAGVLLAMSIPATTEIDYEEFKDINSQMSSRLEKIVSCEPEEVDTKSFQNTALTIEKACRNVEAPLHRTEVLLTPWVAFLIVPLFVLANAGVGIDMSLFQMLSQPVTLGILFGLVIGKPAGVLISLWIAEKTGIVKIPDILDRGLMIGVALLSGVGFTISLFISGLSFGPGLMLESAKTGILLASLVSAVLAFLTLRHAVAKPESQEAEETVEMALVSG